MISRRSAILIQESLNALSGIGGFQTVMAVRVENEIKRLNALSGIGGFQTGTILSALGRREWGLNALSGIGGFQTETDADLVRQCVDES